MRPAAHHLVFSDSEGFASTPLVTTLCTIFEMKPVNFVHLLSALQATMIGDTRLLGWSIDHASRAPTIYKEKSHNPDDSSTLYNLTSEQHNLEVVLLFFVASVGYALFRYNHTQRFQQNGELTFL